MLELTRTVRLALNDQTDLTAPIHNGYAGWPAGRGLARHYALDVHCVGEADPVTGYFINIKHIDAAVRQHALPVMQQFLRTADGDHQVPLGALLRAMLQRLQAPLNQTVQQLTLHLSAFHSLTVETALMDHALLRQQFEFSAAHRLHVPSLSSDENRRIFGKCNNPSGHGHNYRLEVALSAPIDPAGQVLEAAAVDDLVSRVVLDALDHKHLNHDVPQFAQLNPSVENIAKVIFEMLAPPAAALGAPLREVTVWETEKTCCTYRGVTATPSPSA